MKFIVGFLWDQFKKLWESLISRINFSQPKQKE